MHFMKRKHQDKEGVATLKLDMSKAYNHVECTYLKEVMLKMGFNSRWVDLVMKCVTTVRYNVFQGNKEIGPIFPQRGL